MSHTWQQRLPGLKAFVASLNHPAQLEHCNTSSLFLFLRVFTTLNVWKTHNIFLSCYMMEKLKKLGMLHGQLCIPGKYFLVRSARLTCNM